MDTTAAALTANSLSFLVCILIAVWYVVPWLRSRPRAVALSALLWVHAGRHIALQIFSAQRAGFAVPDRLRDQIALGDVAGMVLAVAALVALHYRVRGAIFLTWVFALETACDLVGSLIGGMQAGMLGAASGVTWMIVGFYVPALFVSLALLIWQLLARRGEVLA
jgi:hypothetical protein